MSQKRNDPPQSNSGYTWDPEKKAWVGPSSSEGKGEQPQLTGWGSTLDDKGESESGYEERVEEEAAAGGDEGYYDDEYYDEYYEQGEPEYVGAGRRLVAFIVDTIIIFIVTTIIALIVNFSVPVTSLETRSTVGGIVVEPGEDTYWYDTDAEARITAEADEGYGFLQWWGDIDTVADFTASDTTIIMYDDYDIRADFYKLPTPDPESTATPTLTPTPVPPPTPTGDAFAEPMEKNPRATIDSYVLIALSFFYFVGFWAWRGQTPGMVLMGAYIVKTDGRPVGIVAALLRYISYLATGVIAVHPPVIIIFVYVLHWANIAAFGLAFLTFLIIAISKTKRGLHDLAAGTMVVRV
ncbi:MAG TPA: RDD family protein [Dehalococcoidia bacterium]|nr:RDD family protein [Dehalococcoidia bacterium]